MKLQTQNAKHKDCEKATENGRSMVEMLGVLAIIGVLSVGGIAGYKSAITKHRANETIDRLLKRAVVIAGQVGLGQQADISGFNPQDGTYTIPNGITTPQGQFVITVEDVPEEVCQKIKDMWTLPTIIPSGSCSGTRDMTFTFNNDLSSDTVEKVCSAGARVCQNGEEKVCVHKDDTYVLVNTGDTCTTNTQQTCEPAEFGGYKCENGTQYICNGAPTSTFGVWDKLGSCSAVQEEPCTDIGTFRCDDQGTTATTKKYICMPNVGDTTSGFWQETGLQCDANQLGNCASSEIGSSKCVVSDGIGWKYICIGKSGSTEGGIWESTYSPCDENTVDACEHAGAYKCAQNLDGIYLRYLCVFSNQDAQTGTWEPAWGYCDSEMTTCDGYAIGSYKCRYSEEYNTYQKYVCAVQYVHPYDWKQHEGMWEQTGESCTEAQTTVEGCSSEYQVGHYKCVQDNESGEYRKYVCTMLTGNYYWESLNESCEPVQANPCDEEGKYECVDGTPYVCTNMTGNWFWEKLEGDCQETHRTGQECSPGEYKCIDGKKSVCVGDSLSEGVWEETASLCVDEQCYNGESRCLGGSMFVCTNGYYGSSGWVGFFEDAGYSCSTDESGWNGRCIEGDSFCGGEHKIICANGVYVFTQQPCIQTDEGCTYGSSICVGSGWDGIKAVCTSSNQYEIIQDDNCLPDDECTPGSYKCYNGELLACTADGFYMFTADSNGCGELYDGEVCTPGELRCVSDYQEQCTNDGFLIWLDKPCTLDECTVGTYECESGILSYCTASQSGETFWTQVGECEE